MFEGTVVSINITDNGATPMRAVPEAHAVPGRGIEGDRYYLGQGTFSKAEPNSGRQITLIEIEAIEEVEITYGYRLDPTGSRRNIVTRDVPLNHLVGKEFTVGDVTLRGVRLNGPCNHLAKLTDPKVKEALVHRGGLRADILTEGVIRPGDAVRGA
jgi:MOSC domain-containing protein YiiM